MLSNVIERCAEAGPINQRDLPPLRYIHPRIWLIRARLSDMQRSAFKALLFSKTRPWSTRAGQSSQRPIYFNDLRQLFVFFQPSFQNKVCGRSHDIWILIAQFSLVVAAISFDREQV